jgi:hypothetical protein
MEPKIVIISILIIIFLIFLLLYLKKWWIFKNPNTVYFDYTDEGECRTDLQACKCPIKIKKSNGKYEDKLLSNYEIEKDYYKVQQDLMPFWSNFSECNAYGIKKRYRIKGGHNQYDVFDQYGNRKQASDNSNQQYYVVDTCDLIPCENYGLDDDDKNICKIRSEGNNFGSNRDDYLVNIGSCDPIITFQDSSHINMACQYPTNRLPFNNVNFNPSVKLLSAPDTETDSTLFNTDFHYNQIRIDVSGVYQPASIGPNGTATNMLTGGN